jgi:hypothetical protein
MVDSYPWLYDIYGTCINVVDFYCRVHGTDAYFSVYLVELEVDYAHGCAGVDQLWLFLEVC